MQVVAASLRVDEAAVRIEYGQAWRERSRMIAGLVKKGYPPEIGVLLPFYWTAKRPEGWYVLGGVYGTECVPGRLYAYSSEEEAESEVSLYSELDLEAVLTMHPAQFTQQVVEDLRRLATREDLTPAV